MNANQRIEINKLYSQIVTKELFTNFLSLRSPNSRSSKAQTCPHSHHGSIPGPGINAAITRIKQKSTKTSHNRNTQKQKKRTLKMMSAHHFIFSLSLKLNRIANPKNITFKRWELWTSSYEEKLVHFLSNLIGQNKVCNQSRHSKPANLNLDRISVCI